MITFWAANSYLLLGVGIMLPFLTSSSFYLLWGSLEVLTWGSFYFFFKHKGKESIKSLFLFFIFQVISSLIWFICFFMMVEEGGEFYFLIAISSILIKFGLIPGHFWLYKIYSEELISPVILISTFFKYIPLFIFSSMAFLWTTPSLVPHLIFIASCFLVIFFILNSPSFYIFLFLSSMMNYSYILLLSSLGFPSLSFITFLSYSMSVLLVIFILKHEKSKEFISPLSMNLNSSIHILLFFGGFPPGALFFLKIVFFENISIVSVNGFLIFLISLCSFLYLLSLVSVFLRLKKKEEYFNFWITKKSKYNKILFSLFLVISSALMLLM